MTSHTNRSIHININNNEEFDDIIGKAKKETFIDSIKKKFKEFFGLKDDQPEKIVV